MGTNRELIRRRHKGLKNRYPIPPGTIPRFPIPVPLGTRNLCGTGWYRSVIRYHGVRNPVRNDLRISFDTSFEWPLKRPSNYLRNVMKSFLEDETLRVNITTLVEDGEEELITSSNATDDFKAVISVKDYNFGLESNRSLRIYIYDFKTPLVIKVIQRFPSASVRNSLFRSP